MRNLLQSGSIIIKENFMDIISKLMQKMLIFEKEPQKIGLSQLKEVNESPVKKVSSLQSKNVKLSDLMRRAS